jgi:hypothetical protein
MSEVKRVELDGLTFEVEPEGEGRQPWGGGTAWQYRVRVTDAEGNAYESPAWGSIHDFESGAYPEASSRDIGYMVVGELLSAYFDPDEFFSMATEGEGGRARAQSILSIIATAERMGPALDRNADAVHEYEDR